MPPTNEVNTVWALSTPLGSTEFITLPSGQTCHAKRIGMESILAAGLLGDADSLSSYVGTKHTRRVRGAKGKPDGEEVNARSIAQDPEALKRLVFLVDRATPLIVADPVVLPHFRFLENDSTEMIPPEDRQAGSIYTDMIGLEDKMYLFQYAMGGTRDLERFRSESAAAVEDVSDGEDVPSPTVTGAPSGGGGKRKRPPRRR